MSTIRPYDPRMSVALSHNERLGHWQLQYACVGGQRHPQPALDLGPASAIPAACHEVLLALSLVHEDGLDFSASAFSFPSSCPLYLATSFLSTDQRNMKDWYKTSALPYHHPCKG